MFLKKKLVKKNLSMFPGPFESQTKTFLLLISLSFLSNDQL